ncbi:MAG: 2-keto-4-pentenoate hydratase [Gammaproteobacteria bacterium]
MDKDIESTAAAAARYLVEARLARRQIDELPAQYVPADLEAGYAIQAFVVERLLEQWGARRVGYKIACTNEHAQALLNSPGPVLGQLLSTVVHRSPASLPAAQFIHRVIEPEFAFEMASDVTEPAAAITGQSVAEHVGRVMPAIEIVDYRFPDMDRYTAATLAADNALTGAWVHGEGITDWQGIDLAAEPVSLEVNGKTLRRGSGAAVLGHPLHALAWLAAELSARGERLRAGDMVTTGVCTDIYLAQPGDHLESHFGALGSVTLSLPAD